MKIIYFSPHPEINMAAPSGPGTHIREIIRGFENGGHEVIRFIAGGETMRKAEGRIVYKSRPIKKLIPSFIWQSLKDFNLRRLDKKQEKQLIALIEREQPDFIYERAYYMMSAGYRAAQKTGVRYCVEINAPYPEEKKAMSGESIYAQIAEKNEARQVSSAFKVFVVSSALKEYLIRKTKTSGSKIIVTPNAVNPSKIAENLQLADELKKQYHITPDEIVFGFVGSIFPYHGVDALIESFHKILKNSTYKLKLLIVGDGAILDDLRSRVHALGIEQHVIFTGNVDHSMIFPHISLMNITVMARSNWYGSPVKIFEYGIMKKCIIAPDVVPVKDVMTDHVDGMLVEDNISSLKKAMLFLLDHPEKSHEFAETFYRKVLAEHTWQHVSDTIISEIK